MKSALGHDFAQVRVHTDAVADYQSRLLAARAFTVGEDVFFASGAYRPHSIAGRGLLAHELTHVVQQSLGARQGWTTVHLQPAIGAQAVKRMLQPRADEPEPRSTTAVLPRFGHDLSRVPIRPRGAGAIQTKLAINTPGDGYEQEADRVADHMVRMAEPQAPSACACGRACPKCQMVHPGYRHERLQTQPVGSNDLEETSIPSVVQEVLSSPGQPLGSTTRAFMESRFGHDFSRVRVHTDARAAESARAVDARAYAVGQDLVFGHGEYEPATVEGRRLLAHELTHVAQQSEAPRRDGVAQRQPAGGSGSAPGSPPATATVFHPGVNHGHTPSGRWADVQASPNSSFWANRACANFSPNVVVGIAIHREFSNKRLALEHLNWYLGNGQGADFVEDAHLDRMLRIDTGVQALLAGLIPTSAPAGGKFTGHTEIEQGHYQNQDFRYAFGAIDRLDFEVDFMAGVVHAWFQDRYEWHPVYPGLYSMKPGDIVRETNCVHAALVELKTGGAADFWMKGEATVPLSTIRSGGGGGGGAGAGASGGTL